MELGDIAGEPVLRLDATASRGAFREVPWIPGEVREIVDYGLGCDGMPANPGEVYLPPT